MGTSVLGIIVVAVVSYLLGSVPFSIIMGQLWKGIDVREHGSKNAGVTNVYRVVGALPAAVVLVLDVAKGAAAVLLLTRISLHPITISPIDLKLLAGLLAIVGHVFPVFASFKGGKGIATGLGALVSIIPIEVGLGLVLFVLIVAATRYVSLGSLSAASFVLVALLIEKYYLGKEIPATLLFAVFLLTGFIFFNHRSNIRRLLQGNENRFGRSKVRADTGTNTNPG